MIQYDKNAWYIIVFTFRGTVIRSLILRLPIFLLLTIGLAILQDAGYSLPKVNSTLHSLLGTALSLLLVFRTNSSYDRYWEGRKLIGAIVNNNRAFMRAAACYTRSSAAGPSSLVQYMDAFLTGLKNKLRNFSNPNDFDGKIANADEREKISYFANPATASLYMMSKWVENQFLKGNIERWHANAMEEYIKNLGDCQGGLERISDTPIPFTYAAHTHQLLLLYLITLPFPMVFTYGYYAIPVVFIIAFGLLGIDEAGVEIEDPFGYDENDLPLDTMFLNIVNDAKAIVELYGPPVHEISGRTGEGWKYV